MRKIPAGQGPGWRREKPTASRLSSLFRVSKQPAWSFSTAARLLRASPYVMEAERLHTQCLWFQVRTHGSFGAVLQCSTDYRKSPSPRGPWASDQVIGAGCGQGAQGQQREFTAALCGVPLSISTFNSFLSFLLSLLSLWLACAFSVFTTT